MKKKSANFMGTYNLKDIAYLKPNAKPYTAISLFTGCGGMDVGTSQAGFQTRVMVEWEKAACKTLEVNFTMAGHQRYCDSMIDLLERNDKKLKKRGVFTKIPNKKGDKFKWAGPDEPKARAKMIENLKKWRNKKPGSWYHKVEPAILCADITKLSTKEILEAGNLRIGECTLLTGGFPCQGFSMANSLRDNANYKYDKRNFLYLECVRVIREALPKTFVLENVAGLVTMEKGAVIKMICKDLAAVGYNVTWYKLNAADYGVPQNRIRVFFFGHRNDLAILKNKNRQQLYLGGVPGTIKHPDWFIEKYGA